MGLLPVLEPLEILSFLSCIFPGGTREKSALNVNVSYLISTIVIFRQFISSRTNYYIV